ncbi:MAG: ornithine cyclodeaminase family protein, partial [Nitrospinota bacterium]
MLILSRSDLETLVSPAEAITAVEEAFRHYAREAYSFLPRQALPLDGRDLLLLMSSYLPGMKALGTKSVTVCFENPARGLPTVMAVYLLHDPETGEPLAFMEAGFLTGIRTGATSAVAARRLARHDARRVACFGAGAQAGFQLRCLKAVLPLTQCQVVSRSRERAEAFARRMSEELAMEFTVAASTAEAVRQADVVITATTSATPVFDGRARRPG